MRTEMSSLDLMFLANELRSLVGGRIQKVYQTDKVVRIQVFMSGKGTFELYFEPGKIFITEYRRPAGRAEPFAMKLRKELTGQEIVNIRQPGFERIIEMETEDNILIFELFSKGNVILCDKDYRILLPLEVQLWKDRQIITKKKYNYPPGVANPFKLSKQDFSGLFRTDKAIVRFLAVDLSFSGTYAEELCLRAGINKMKPSNQLDSREISALYEAVQSFLKEPSPQIVFENKKPINVVPFDMRLYRGKETRKFRTLATALDEYFTHRESVGMEIEKKIEISSELGKIGRIEGEQKKAVKKWKEKERESRKKAEAIYNNFEFVQKVIDDINKARESGRGWEEIKKSFRKEKKVKEIMESEGKIVLSL